MSNISWRYVNDKVVICKDSVYFALEINELSKLEDVLIDIADGTKKFYRTNSRKDKNDFTTREATDTTIS